MNDTSGNDTSASGTSGSGTSGSGDISGTVVFLFDTTHHALWAEEVAQAVGLPAEVVPAPPDRGEARCDLALETFRRMASDLGGALSKEGVDFYWPEGVSAAESETLTPRTD